MTTMTTANSTQANIEAAREAIELLGTGAIAEDGSLERLFAPNVRHFGPGRDFCPATLLLEGQPEPFAGFSDRQVEVHDLSTIGNRVMARITFTGRHTGQYQDCDASGEIKMAKGLVTLRFGGGRITEASSVLRWE